MSLAISLVRTFNLDSFESAAIELTTLGSQIRSRSRTKTEADADIVRYRFWRGRVVSESTDKPWAEKHGAGLVSELAKQADVAEKTLYHEKRFYEKLGTESALNRLLGLWEDEGKSITWSHAKAWTYQSIKGESAQTAQELQEKRIAKIEKLSERLSEMLVDATREIKEYTDEQMGVIVMAAQTAQDTERQLERVKEKTAEMSKRETDERYLAYVRSHPCVVPMCKQPRDGVEAHHVDRRSQGGSDYSSVPLCAHHHTALHAGHHVLEGVDLWHEAWEMLSKYLRAVMHARK